MEALNSDLQDVLIKHARAGNMEEVTVLAAFLRELKNPANEPIAVPAQPAPIAVPDQRFVKISDIGLLLPRNAEKWVAVLDEETGLMWPTASSEKEFTNKASNSEAEAYCKSLVLAGFKDWRLPTRKELLSLVDDTRCDPAIDKSFFRGVRSAWHWTSTNYAGDSGCAWGVGFGYGASGWSGCYAYGHALAVRSARQ